MANIVKNIFMTLIAIALIVGTFFNVKAILNIPNVATPSTSKEDLQRISGMLWWAFFINLAGLLLLFLFVGVSSAFEQSAGAFEYTAPLVTGVVAVIATILSLVASSKLRSDVNLKAAANDATIAGLASLIGVILIIINVIWTFITVKREEKTPGISSERAQLEERYQRERQREREQQLAKATETLKEAWRRGQAERRFQEERPPTPPVY